MKEQEILEEIQRLARSIDDEAKYLEDITTEVDDDMFQATGPGTYQMSVELSIENYEGSISDAEQHCSRIAGNLRDDAATRHFEVTDMSVELVDPDTEEE